MKTAADPRAVDRSRPFPDTGNAFSDRAGRGSIFWGPETV